MIKPVTDPEQLHECLWSYLSQLSLICCTDRVRLANAAFMYVMECHKALWILTTCKQPGALHGPTFALMRSMLEGLQRGYWLYYCAPDDRIKALNLCHFPELQKSAKNLFSSNIVKDIENNEHFNQGRLLCFKNFLLREKAKNNRDAMNSYTHVGYHMLRSYISGKAIESNFDPEIVHEILRLANHCACFAVMGAAEIIANNDIATKIFHIHKNLS